MAQKVWYANFPKKIEKYPNKFMKDTPMIYTPKSRKNTPKNSAEVWKCKNLNENKYYSQNYLQK